MSEELKQIRSDYQRTFQSRSGVEVLEDMRKSYHDVSVADEDDSLEHIPPEHRVWFIEGRRDVYLSITRMLKLQIEENDNETES